MSNAQTEAAETVRFIRGDAAADAAPRQLQLSSVARPSMTPAAELEAVGDDAPSWAEEAVADEEAAATPQKRRWRLPIIMVLLVLGSSVTAAAWQFKVGPFAAPPRATPMAMPMPDLDSTAAPAITMRPDTTTPDRLVPLNGAVAERPRVDTSAIATRDTAGDSAAAVRGAPVALRVRPGNTVLLPGEVQRLAPLLFFANGEAITPRQLSWSSGNADVVAVDARGRITGVAPGTTVVFARRGVLSALVSVTVRFALAAQLEITPTDPIIEKGGTVRLRASLRDASGAPMPSRPLTWSSSNDEVAIVSSNGVVVGVAPGVATITASADAVSATISVMVR